VALLSSHISQRHKQAAPTDRLAREPQASRAHLPARKAEDATQAEEEAEPWLALELNIQTQTDYPHHVVLHHDSILQLGLHCWLYQLKVGRDPAPLIQPPVVKDLHPILVSQIDNWTEGGLQFT
jgi:hypothetical protein